MSFKEIINRLDHLLSQTTRDLAKVHQGNKAAAQRVRVGTINLGKLAKMFRKESIAAEKSGRLRKPRVKKKR